MKCVSPLTGRVTSGVAYKVKLAERLEATMRAENLSAESVATCGASKKATSNRFRSATETSKYLYNNYNNYNFTY